MADVIDLGAARAAREPHTTGPCRCLKCGHKWEGVVPIGVDALECPDCGEMAGVRSGLCVNLAEEHWTCACGGQFFHLITTGVYCPCCGRAWEWGVFQ